MHVIGIPKVYKCGNISLRYRGTKRYEKIENEGHGLSRNIISNLRG